MKNRAAIIVALWIAFFCIWAMIVARADASFPVLYHTMSGEWDCTAVSSPGTPVMDGLADLTCEQPGWTYRFAHVHYGEDLGQWEGVY